MEKIGLFDILDKFGRTTNGKTDFASGKKTPADENGRAADRDFTLRDPEDCAPPQYMMNAKMLAFIRRHEELVAAVPPKTPAKRGRKKNSAAAQRQSPDENPTRKTRSADVATNDKSATRQRKTTAATTEKPPARQRKTTDATAKQRENAN